MIYCADLFCGSGGTSTGLMQAAEELGLGVSLVAVNHWQTAIETHTTNHPGVTHYCEDLETVNPRHAVPGGHLHLLVASPECTHHSNARGGRPMSDQSRASAWHVLRWAEALHIDHILIENVKEFRDWGPLHGCTCGLGDAADTHGPHTKDCKRGRPIAAMKGRLYRQFLASLRALGYTVAERVVNAADFGDATTRQRLFIQARRGTKRPVWPAATHIKPCEDPMGLLTEYQKWKPARDIIDWTLPSNSIYSRKKPLVPATMARIMAGLRKYSGLPFLVPNLSEREGQAPRTHDIDAPLPTVTTFGGGNLVEPFLIGAGGPLGSGEPQSIADPLGTVLTVNHRALVQPFVMDPFVIGQQSCAAPRSANDPLPTIATAGAISLVQPYLVVLRHNSGPSGLEEPVPTLTAGGTHMALAEPFLVVNRTHSDAKAMDEPIPTLTTGGNMALAQPFIVATGHKGGNGSYTYPGDRPLPTLTTQAEIGVVEPFLVPVTHQGDAGRVNDVNLPLPTVTTAKRGEFALCEPFLSKFHGSHSGKSDGDRRNLPLDAPLPTLDTSNRVGLAEPFLVSYYGQSGPTSLAEPLDTITARDRFALVDPQLVTDGMLDKGDIVGWLDIRFRMLQPKELAAAMSFPADYQFAGNREAQVKQIGNSVAVQTAKALCLEILKGIRK